MANPKLNFITGTDHLAVRDELNRWKTAFITKHGDSDLEEWDGDQIDMHQLIQSLRSAPFLCEKRLIIIKNLIQNKKADDLNTLLPFLEQIPDGTLALFVESGSPDKRSSFYKKLSTEATVKSFEAPPSKSLKPWIEKRALRHRCTMAPGGADHLLRWVGEDLLRLDHELEKLSLYATAKLSPEDQNNPEKIAVITPAIIEFVTPSSAEKSIFAWTDAFSQKNVPLFIKLTHELESSGQDALYLFSMLARQVRLLLQIKSLVEEGESSSTEIAKRLGLHPFVAQSTLKYIRNFSLQELAAKLAALKKLDHRMKTGQIAFDPKNQTAYLLQLELML